MISRDDEGTMAVLRPVLEEKSRGMADRALAVVARMAAVVAEARAVTTIRTVYPYEACGICHRPLRDCDGDTTTLCGGRSLRRALAELDATPRP